MRKKQHSSTLMQVEFVCPKCGKKLAWALPTAEINCPKCGTWVTSRNRKIENNLFLPLDSDQMVLFC
ncbi:MAG: hypothetical protein IJ320_02105 [Phascolarctobacterium sp.]|nr:hypothetical protein [Phascolarctobacterium sp.]